MLMCNREDSKAKVSLRSKPRMFRDFELVVIPVLAAIYGGWGCSSMCSAS